MYTASMHRRIKHNTHTKNKWKKKLREKVEHTTVAIAQRVVNIWYHNRCEENCMRDKKSVENPCIHSHMAEHWLYLLCVKHTRNRMQKVQQTRERVRKGVKKSKHHRSVLFQWLVSMRHLFSSLAPDFIDVAFATPSTFTALHIQIVCGLYLFFFSHSSRFVLYLGTWTCHVWFLVMRGDFDLALHTPSSTYTHTNICKKKLVYIRCNVQKKKECVRGLFALYAFGCISHRNVLNSTFALFYFCRDRFLYKPFDFTLNYIPRDLMCECWMFYLLMFWFIHDYSPFFSRCCCSLGIFCSFGSVFPLRKKKSVAHIQ